jgi:flagellar hook protein FlgE
LTDGYRPLRAEQTALESGGTRTQVRRASEPRPVQLEREIANQIVAKTQYSASVRIFQVGAAIHGLLFDIFA